MSSKESLDTEVSELIDELDNIGYENMGATRSPEDTIEPKPEQQLHARQTSSKAQRKFSSGRVGAQWVHSGSGEHGKLAVKRNSSEYDMLHDIREGSYTYHDLYQELCTDDPMSKGFDDGSFKQQVDEKRQKYHLGESAAEVEVVIDRLIAKYGGSMDKALLSVVSESRSMSKAMLLVSKLLYRGADAGAQEDDGQTALHFTTKRGFVSVAERLLEFGASATQRDNMDRSPLSIALSNRHDRLIALFIGNTDNSEVRDMFSRSSLAGQNPSISLHELIKSKKMKLTVLAVLDCLVDVGSWVTSGSLVNYSLLEADEQGFTPDNELFHTGQTTCLQLITQSGNQEFISHPAVRLLVRRKWRVFARNRFTFSAMLYLLALLFLTASAIMGIETKNPAVYDTNKPWDMARLACEVVVLFMITTTVIQEVFEAFKLGRDYFLDWYNYLDVSSSVLLILVIPLRFMEMPEQWGVYSMGYMLSIVRIFKYSAIFRRLRAYSQIIWRMTTREFVDFIIMFLVIIVAFTGSFAMSLRLTGQLSDTNNIRTSTFWNILLTFVRVLIEDEAVLTYFNDQGHVFGWYATILFLVFLFISMVMLMNILIAQLSDTYESMRRDAHLEVDLNRAWIVARVERNTMAFCCRVPYQVRHYVENERITSDRLARFQTETEYHKEDSQKQINDIQLQLHDIDLSARSIRNRQRNQDAILEEILGYIREQRGAQENNNNN